MMNDANPEITTSMVWPKDEERFRVFISYSRRDSEEVAHVLVNLLGQQGLSAKLDTTHLEFGEKWQMQLKDFIRQADAVVFVISPGAVRSHWCRWELAECAHHSKRLVPVEYIPVPPEELPPQIAEIQFFPSRLGADLIEVSQHLAEGLEKRSSLASGTHTSYRACPRLD